MARKYGKKTSEKVERTMHEFKRGKLKSGTGGKVTSRKQAIAIGLSQARARGYKVPPSPSHATARWKPGRSLNDLVRDYLSKMRPGTKIDARGIARALGGVDPLSADYALEDAERAGLATSSDGRWFSPAGGSVHHATRASYAREKSKSPAQLDREIAEALGDDRGRGRRYHASVTEGSGSIYHVAGSKFGVEIDPAEFDKGEKLPKGARWRDDLAHMAESELGRGRTYRRPRNARYTVVEWTSYRGELGKLLDWLEGTPGITRYAEIFE